MTAYRDRVRELYDTGKTLREIAALLNASGSRMPNGRGIVKSCGLRCERAIQSRRYAQQANRPALAVCGVPLVSVQAQAANRPRYSFGVR
jgi:hypothetical protein